VVIFNLWESEASAFQGELDFDSDLDDIRLVQAQLEAKEPKIIVKGLMPGEPSRREVDVAVMRYDRYKYSLRAYMGILYLRRPPGFTLLLRGTPVPITPIVATLQQVENETYRPQNQDPVPVLIGFAREAPNTNASGFCVYHRDRLIKPFWQVTNIYSVRIYGVRARTRTSTLLPRWCH
jgi:hypothetical protein